ncbi:MAG: hypothetical protein LBL66_06210 [Clostridiales bacterium]|jgi:DNA-directed RNA polymerase specialized sigma subunit|nr:hypothetical protein [Clostridiales bacterium]
MATIKYKMADGRVEEIEVTDEFAAKYAEFEQEEQRRVWREQRRKRREVSLERLMASGWDIADPVNRDPLELLIEQESPRLPLFTDLTDYQRRVAVKFFVEHRTHGQIAREEGVSQQAISKLIKKSKTKSLPPLNKGAAF